MARNFSNPRLIALVALAVLAVAWTLPRPPPAQGADRLAVNQVFAGAAIGGTTVAGFSLQIDSLSTNAKGDPYTAVCADTPSYLPRLWGTYIGGDSFSGRVESKPLPVASGYWYLPIIGYPSARGNRLYVEIKSADGSSIQRYTYFGPNPGETLGLWALDVRRWRGGLARVVLEDGTQDRGGWLGVGAPIASDQAGAGLPTLMGGPTDYPQYWLTGLILAVLIFLPGFALRHWLGENSWTEPPLLPLPGLALLGGYGLLLWICDAGSNGLGRHLFLIGHGLIAASCCWPRGPRRAFSPAHWIWGPYVALAVLAAAYCGARRPVTQEQNRLTSFQSRMVASPPDHLIPYATAAYFHAGYSGQSHSADYFGTASAASRGPLAPWIINAAFNLLRLRPSDPPESTADAWPAAADGYYAARWVGFLTNACAIAGVAALAGSLGRRTGFSLLWAAAAPVTFVNTSFAWPKLFAAYFILLAAADCIRGRAVARSSLWTAAAYLCHPIGALFALPLLCLTGRSRGWRAAIQYGLGTALFAAPWLLFKYSLHRPDAALRYPLGDGNGYHDAANALSWLRARWLNLWYTLVPGAFSVSPVMRSWLWGPLKEPARWAIQYAKTLPGNLGYMGAALAYFALGRLCVHQGRTATSPELRRFAGWFILPCLAVMVLYWGFSSDGLGRNCLEPLSLAIIAWTSAARPLSIRASALLLGFVAVETMTMVVCGFL
jgi:hypothetical protein